METVNLFFELAGAENVQLESKLTRLTGPALLLASCMPGAVALGSFSRMSTVTLIS